MHAVQPGQHVRILTIQLAVPDEVDPDLVSDEISELLTEQGICAEASHILDWRYLTEYQPLVTAGDDPEEGEIFGQLDFQLNISPKE
jgi:hypothetical protein